ncbi:MAG: hypothetical protein LC667_09465 [Thioalkalivibrio sp.]|nr:hypothetical protein [Thioalkalivibrio sp.]
MGHPDRQNPEYTGSHPGLGPLELPKDGLVCMVFPVLAADAKELRERGLSDFRVGTWGVSTGAHENTVVHGPFESLEHALQFGRLEVGVTEFFGTPNLDCL